MKLLITGSTGLVGSRFLNLYKNTYSISTLGRQNTDKIINLSSKKDVVRAVMESDAQSIINFAAYTKVDEAEKEKGDKNGEVHTINVLLPTWLAQACKSTGKTLHHISTDYVFDGKSENKPYSEDDTPLPVDSWYSITKYKGEVTIQETGCKHSIVRVSYPYSGVYKKKSDIARTVINKLKEKVHYLGVTDQKIKPTSVDDIAVSINLLLEKKAQGIFHVAGNFLPLDYTTPYQFAVKLAAIFNLDQSLIKAVSFEELSKIRNAPRPKHTWLETKKIESLGFRSTNIEDSLRRFKEQLTNSDLTL